MYVNKRLTRTFLGTLDVRVRGDLLFPPSIGGQLSILFSILRQLSLVLSVGVFTTELKTLDPDVIIVDQLSACIPLFRFLYPKARILFYGHFPDQLLANNGEGFMKRVRLIYRSGFDFIEGWSTRCADSILVNSKFTRKIFKETFPNLRSRELKVVYPCVDTQEKTLPAVSAMWPDKKIILSINRFEGKKNLDLAIRAYAGLSTEERSKAKLILAGGYDPRAPDNAWTHKHLQELSDSLDLTHATFRYNDTLSTDLTTEDVDTLFLLSIPNELKQRLLQSASLLVYTPANEHFGIVPLEGMLAGVPVLATNTGGPLETIYDGRTGWLRSPEKIDQWTEVMRKPLIPSSEGILRLMGQEGRKRVLSEFSHTKMTHTIDQEMQRLIQSNEPRPVMVQEWVLIVALMTIFALVGGFVALRSTGSLASKQSTSSKRAPR